MLGLTSDMRFRLHVPPCDMRKGFHGLEALVQQDMGEVPMSGAVYVFLNRKGDRIKLLRWEPGGYVMYCKLLETGRFRIPNRQRTEHRKVTINYAQLAMLIEGLDFEKTKQNRRYLPPSSVDNFPGKT
jgi:transposase